MNDYLNHKWRNWVNEDRSPRRPRRKLNENQEAPAKVTQSKKVLHYPQFQLNDDFGKKGTPLRDEVEKFFRQVSRKRSLPAKLAAIQKFLNPSKAYVKSMSIKKCLGTLTMLDTFSTLVHKFDPSSAGYLMEPFMAAVYGGKGRQVKTGEGGIEDIWDFNGKFISLKLLAGGPIEGSLRDLRRTIYDLNNNQPITYIVVEKIGEAENISQLKFYEFTIGTDGREWQWVTERGKKLYKKDEESIDWIPRRRGVKGAFLADAHTGRANASPFQKTGQLDPDTTYAPPGPGEPHERGQVSYGGGSAPKFKIPWSVATDDANLIGEIAFGGGDWVQTVAQQYVSVLQGGVTQLYGGLDTLTKSINSFLISDDAGAGSTAQQAAENLVKSTNCVVDQQNCPILDDEER